MKFQVGRFVCELSLDDRGEVQTQWLPGQPRYLKRDERTQYLTRRSEFMELVQKEAVAPVPGRMAGLSLN
jgi:hypothetical protein